MSNATKLIGLCVIALAVLVIGTQPDQLPSLMLVLPFVLIFLLILVMVVQLFQKIGAGGRKNLGVAMLVAALPVVLLAMQSLGQLTPRDVITILAVFAVAYFYMHRRTRSPS